MFGREEEKRVLLSLLESDKSEFVAVYGRRRVGKTFLVRETFNYKFAFQHTGLQDANIKEQLEEFANSLIIAGMKKVKRPKNWSQAFFMLGQHLNTLPEGKKVVFIDELPWLDAPNSKFVSALDHFWNGWATARKDIVLVVCGSATSWIMDKIVMNYGGLHNRLTEQIFLRPFTLHECEQYAQQRNLGMSRRNILETYMILGGIPFYWDMLRKDLSWAQNIDRMFFYPEGKMRNEFEALYRSLFRRPQSYIDVVSALGTKKAGMTRNELIAALGEDNGGTLTKVLKELEQCGFIRSFNSIGKAKKESLYQLIDNFTLFYFKFMADGLINEKDYWTRTISKPIYNAWSGLAFERVCFQHIDQIKRALGISGIISNVYSWVYIPKDKEEKGAQIDMLIDRDDNVINVCEMKFSQGEYELTEKYDLELRNKVGTFQSKTKTRKGVSLVMITSYGLKRNAWANGIQSQITMDDLFQQ
ncbi:MAG: ATP-binding protein [Paludibacteraceae bacterium]|nr:ATP-binding protein [Paludibacteraceae bacterium]